ncbi:zinc finger, CCHC-type containing protein [Tanacetum coccineum]
MASIHNMIIHQMDVKTSFLNGELEEEVYMNQPWGFIMPVNENKVLYKGHGEADGILGIRIKHKSNDIAISQSYCIEKEMGEADVGGDGVGWVVGWSGGCGLMGVGGWGGLGVGWEGVRGWMGGESGGGVLKKFNYFDCTPVSTPIDTSKKLMPNNGQTVSQLEYSRVIGCLMYVMTCKRLNIACVVGKLSKYTSNPGTQQWQAIQRVLKYLKKTIDYRLICIGYPSVVEGYTNASWISNTKDNFSTSGWVFFLGGGAISWASKKQTCITCSTMESKFVALVAAGKEAKWLKNLLFKIAFWSKPMAPMYIRYDSAATLAKAYNQMYNGKSRHLGVRHNMIRELITNGMVSVTTKLSSSLDEWIS